ncbi:MAG: ABC transporter ATP-binding protein [Clostridia bacterium]
MKLQYAVPGSGDIIKIKGLSKTYGGREVLSIDSLTLRQGRKYAVIGPNGSGKSTLIRIIAGVIQADNGQVEIGTQKHTIGYMPQTPYAFARTVQKNVMLALEGEADAAAMALRALKRVGMGELSQSRGNRLSGGETQRMAFARMIAKPRILLLLDEPTAAADLTGEELMEQTLLEYAKSTGCTLLFSTHSPKQALHCADELIVLCDGRVVEKGDAKAVIYAPHNMDAQRFLANWRL